MSDKKETSAPEMVDALALRKRLPKITSRDTLTAMLTTVGGSYTAGVDSWQLAVSEYAYKCSVADVFGDKRAKDATATYSVTEFGKFFSVTGSRVSQWRRAGLALNVGCGEGDVKLFLRSSGQYDTEALDAALAEGRKDALAFAMGERDRKREEAKAAKDETDDETGTPEDSTPVAGALTLIGEAAAPGDTLADVIDRLLPRILASDSEGVLIAVRDTLAMAASAVAERLAEVQGVASETEPTEVPAAS
jgi:hypothetical protein